MPENDDAIALFKQQQQQLEDAGWANFKAKRDDIDGVIFRTIPVPQTPDMPKVSVQSTQAERGLHQAVGIMKMNPTKLNTVSLDQAPKAKDDVEDIRIWDGTFWHKQNDKRRLDTSRADQAYRYGVAVERLFWDMPGEYDDEDEAEEALLQRAGKDEREAYFKGLNSDHWLIEPVNPKSCKWLPVNEDPDLFFEVSEISYAEAKNLQNYEGKYFSLDEQRKIRFLGERAPVAGSSGDYGTSGPNKIKVTTRYMKDPDTGKGTISNFVETDGASADAAQLDEVEVPFGRCPYFVIPSGEFLPSETDPNLRYRAPIFPLVEAVNRKNFHVTTFTRLVLKYTDNFYVDASSVKDPAQAAFIDNLFPTEGQGAQRGAVIPIPKPGANEMPVHLHIERYPFELDSVSQWVLENIEKDIEDSMPSRFQTGNLSRTEVANETATTMVESREASALPWESHLANFDGYGTKAEIDAVHECIQYWGGDKPYYTVSSGDEPLLKGAPESGTQVYIDANKLKRPFQLVVQTENKTQAERQQDLNVTLQLAEMQWITEEQALERSGFDDPRKQMELLEAEKQRMDADPFKRELITQMRQQLLTALLGAPPPLGMQQAGVAPPQGVPQIGAPQGRPQAPGMGQTGPAVTPAPVTMEGGSSGSVGVTP